MAIPISYNIRNLKLRKGLTIMTALGIALTVTTAIFLMALLAGLQRAFVSSGNPNNVLVLRKGSEAELSGGFDSLRSFQLLRRFLESRKTATASPWLPVSWW
jgi:putative ABC transport system permease protein